VQEPANPFLSAAVLQRIRKHSVGAENRPKKVLRCHFCGACAVHVFDDARGHIQAKCRKCKREAIYNVVLCRNGTIRYRLLTA
jgi:hypothetical protein